MPDRLDELGAVIAHALREMRKVPNGSRDLHSEALARVLLKRCGPTERAYLLATAAKAAPDRELERMVFDLGGPPPL